MQGPLSPEDKGLQDSTMESDGDADAESAVMGEASTNEEEEGTPIVGPAAPVRDAPRMPPPRPSAPSVQEICPSLPRHTPPEPVHTPAFEDHSAESSRLASNKMEVVSSETDVQDSGKGPSSKKDSYFGPTADYLGSQKEEVAVVVPPPRYNKKALALQQQKEERERLAKIERESRPISVHEVREKLRPKMPYWKRKQLEAMEKKQAEDIQPPPPETIPPPEAAPPPQIEARVEEGAELICEYPPREPDPPAPDPPVPSTPDGGESRQRTGAARPLNSSATAAELGVHNKPSAPSVREESVSQQSERDKERCEGRSEGIAIVQPVGSEEAVVESTGEVQQGSALYTPEVPTSDDIEPVKAPVVQSSSEARVEPETGIVEEGPGEMDEGGVSSEKTEEHGAAGGQDLEEGEMVGEEASEGEIEDDGPPEVTVKGKCYMDAEKDDRSQPQDDQASDSAADYKSSKSRKSRSRSPETHRSSKSKKKSHRHHDSDSDYDKYSDGGYRKSKKRSSRYGSSHKRHRDDRYRDDSDYSDDYYSSSKKRRARDRSYSPDDYSRDRYGSKSSRKSSKSSSHYSSRYRSRSRSRSYDSDRDRRKFSVSSSKHKKKKEKKKRKRSSSRNKDGGSGEDKSSKPAANVLVGKVGKISTVRPLGQEKKAEPVNPAASGTDGSGYNMMMMPSQQMSAAYYQHPSTGQVPYYSSYGYQYPYSQETYGQQAQEQATGEQETTQPEWQWGGTDPVQWAAANAAGASSEGQEGEGGKKEDAQLGAEPTTGEGAKSATGDGDDAMQCSSGEIGGGQQQSASSSLGEGGVSKPLESEGVVSMEGVEESGRGQVEPEEERESQSQTTMEDTAPSAPVSAPHDIAAAPPVPSATVENAPPPPPPEAVKPAPPPIPPSAVAEVTPPAPPTVPPLAAPPVTTPTPPAVPATPPAPPVEPAPPMAETTLPIPPVVQVEPAHPVLPSVVKPTPPAPPLPTEATPIPSPAADSVPVLSAEPEVPPANPPGGKAPPSGSANTLSTVPSAMVEAVSPAPPQAAVEPTLDEVLMGDQQDRGVLEPAVVPVAGSVKSAESAQEEAPTLDEALTGEKSSIAAAEEGADLAGDGLYRLDVAKPAGEEIEECEMEIDSDNNSPKVKAKDEGGMASSAEGSEAPLPPEAQLAGKGGVPPVVVTSSSGEVSTDGAAVATTVTPPLPPPTDATGVAVSSPANMYQTSTTSAPAYNYATAYNQQQAYNYAYAQNYNYAQQTAYMQQTYGAAAYGMQPTQYYQFAYGSYPTATAAPYYGSSATYQTPSQVPVQQSPAVVTPTTDKAKKGDFSLSGSKEKQMKSMMDKWKSFKEDAA